MIVAGFVSDTLPTYHLKSFITRIGEGGDIEWVKYYGTADEIYFPTYDVNTSIGDSVIVLGTWGNVDNVLHTRLIWMNGLGDTLRTAKCYSPYLDLEAEQINDWNYPTAMTSDLEGNVYLASIIDSSGQIDFLISKFDLLGNELWKIPFHYSSEGQTCNALYANNLGVLVGFGEISPDEDEISLTRILQLSPEGDILNEIEEESFGIDVAQPSEITQLDDNTIIVAASEVQDWFEYRPLIYAVDFDGMSWYETHSDWFLPSQVFTNVIVANDGNLIAAGIQYDEIEMPDEVNGEYNLNALVVKYSSGGQLVWERTISYVVSTLDDHQLHDLKECEDGSIVFCGEATDQDVGNPENVPPFQQAWVVKLDECGCLIPGCDPNCEVDTGVTHIVYSDSNFVLGPNPAQEQLFVHLVDTAPHDDRWFELFDYRGKLVKRFKAMSGQTTYVLPTQDLPQGLMVLSLIEEGKIIQSEKVMIR